MAELAVTVDKISNEDKAAQIVKAIQALKEATDDHIIRHCNEIVACLENA